MTTIKKTILAATMMGTSSIAIANMGDQGGNFIIFESEISESCGINILSNSSELLFEGESESEKGAQFRIISNSNSERRVDLTIKEENRSPNLEGVDMHYILDSEESDNVVLAEYPGLHIGGVGQPKTHRLNARVNADPSDITAGSARLDSVLTVSCY